MFSAIFVDRPRLAIVIAIVTTIAGALAYIAMPVAQYPDIVPPQVSVTTFYPGANSAVVDATVAQPIEAQVVGVDKMIYMKSTSGDDGSYTLTASFELGTDPDINTVNVNNRVQTALSLLPPEVQRQGINVKKKSTAILAFITVYSPKHTHDPLFLSNYATINLLDSIKSTPGVGDAYLFAAQDYAMRAWVKTERLTGLNLTVNDIITAIQSQNIQAAVGRIGARPMFNDQQLQLNIQTKGRLSSTEDFDNIVIRTNPDGSILRLRDVAQLELGAANLDRDTRFNGDNAAAIVVYQSPGGNAIDTVNALRAKLADAEKRFPEDLAWTIPYDPTVFVKDTVHEVKKTLLEAFVLVVLVVFLFLGNVRATLIPTLAVPVSLIGTFIVLKAVGYSANTVSLLAIVLAIGIVVDDAIVVVENVERVMEEHPELSPAEASKRAMAEITAPIIAITLVLLSVFVPIAFIPGISGELFRQFAVTVAVAMLLSAINALTLSPALCAVLLSPHHGPKRGFIGKLMRGIDWVRDQYGAVVARLVRFFDHWARDGIGGRGGDRWSLKGHANRVCAGGRPGRDVCRSPAAGRRLGRAHVGRDAPGRGDDKGGSGRSRIYLDHWVELHRQLFGAERRLHGGHIQTVRRTQERRPRRSRSDPQAASKIPPDPGWHRSAAGAAADRGPRNGRRLYVCSGRPSGRRSQRTRPGSAWSGRGGQPGSATAWRILDLLGDQSVDLSRYRSRQGADPRRSVEGRVPGTAGLARRLLHQQPESVWRAPGRCRSRRRPPTDQVSTTSIASMCAVPTGR